MVLLEVLVRRFVLVLAVGVFCLPVAAQDFSFDGSISEPVLNNYLSRSITMVDFLKDDINQRNKHGVDPKDNIRMILNVKAKFIGRAIRVQGDEKNFLPNIKNGKVMAAAIHAADPDVILEAGEFEVLTPDVESLTVPKSVLAEYKQPIVDRKFKFDKMIFGPGEGGKTKNDGKAIPDITKVETQMWFYYQSIAYIDIGVEAIHYGQVSLIGKNDKDFAIYYDLMKRVRAYAQAHGRRHLVLCNAHEPHDGIVEGGKLLFDFHEKPLRIKDVDGQPFKGVLEVGYADSMYQRSVGGITPSGWKCEHLPYLVEFDNFGSYVKTPGKPSGRPFIWGWDEITWFGLMPEDYRDAWLKYAYDWLKKNDPMGHIEMPGSRVMFPGPGVTGPDYFFANTKSAACPKGFGTETTIKEIWEKDALPKS